MKTSRFTDSQIMAVLKEAQAGVKVPDLCRTHGISTATILSMALEVRRHGRADGGSVEGVGGQKPTPQENVR